MGLDSHFGPPVPCLICIAVQDRHCPQMQGWNRVCCRENGMSCIVATLLHRAFCNLQVKSKMLVEGSNRRIAHVARRPPFFICVPFGICMYDTCTEHSHSSLLIYSAGMLVWPVLDSRCEPLPLLCHHHPHCRVQADARQLVNRARSECEAYKVGASMPGSPEMAR